LASSDKTNESVGARKVSDNHCVQKDERSYEMSSVESTNLSQRLIHDDVRIEVCIMAVDAFVLALVHIRLNFSRISSGSCLFAHTSTKLM